MASSSSYCHSAPVSSSRSCKYDVFISFRGEDTRKTFVDHLYSSLVQKTIHTYKDDKTIVQGESIAPSLFAAIEESQIAVIIFSENYADSSWCLEELAFIMKCKEERGLIVMPIFYDVEPSEVRKQKRKFGEAFATHEIENTCTKVESWRKALVDASNIAGWETKNFANGHESEFIKEVVEKIFHRLLPSGSDVDEAFVGMATRLHDLKLKLDIGSDCVRMVGIWGVGGGGKTTLATSIYMEISHLFEGSCIVENIRDKSSKSGLEKLQENIISSVFNTKVKVHSITEGKNMLKSMLCRRKVLVVLDDVDDKKQLEGLAGSHNWYGRGSRVIITTRDEHLLRAHKVEEVYPVRLLSDEEAIQLFNKHAYNENEPIKNYEALSLDVISYAKGLPLALKVIGSFLVDKDEEGWLSALARLKAIPETEIVEQLKISYDGLKTEEKELFLDIACFFRGSSTEDAMEIFEACGFYPKIGIQVLRQKALITFEDGKFANEKYFDMHDLVQEMAHYIVRREHPENPENHSRVWKHEELRNIGYGGATMENDRIEAIPYNYYDSSLAICKFFSNMKRLRWLKVATYDQKNDGGPSFLSNELRFIDWNKYPGSSFPDSFQPMKLVVLKLTGSLQKELWKGKKHLPHLKVLQLKDMKNLVCTPDLDGLPCLQKLTLDDCRKLEEIHPLLGNHASLEYVRVSSCAMLRIFPRIVRMDKLKTLEIMFCSEIREFPEIQANMESLVNLSLRGTNILNLPSSIGEHCAILVSLDLRGCFALKSIEFDLDALKHLQQFDYGAYNRQLEKVELQLFETHFPRSLRKLELGVCNLEDGKIPSEIGKLCNLEELVLSQNDFSQLDFSLLQLTRLKVLNLSECTNLVNLPELPSSVAILIADHCSLLNARDFYRDCKWLCGVSLVDGGIINDGVRLLESMLEGKTIENGTMLLRLEGVEIPRRFTPSLHKGRTFGLQLPENWSNDFCGFLICAVLERNFERFYSVRISMKEVMSGMDSLHDDDIVDWEESDDIDCGNWTWVGYVSFASLRHTSWWHPTYNHISFHMVDQWPFNIRCRGIGARLVAWKSGKEWPTETSSTHSSDYSHYTPKFNILNDDSGGDLIMLFDLN